MDNRKLYEDIMRDVRSVFMKRVNEDLLDDVGEVRVDSAAKVARESLLRQVDEAVEKIMKGQEPDIDLQDYVAVW